METFLVLLRDRRLEGPPTGRTSDGLSTVLEIGLEGVVNRR
jgi:hypothetical protein